MSLFAAMVAGYNALETYQPPRQWDNNPMPLVDPLDEDNDHHAADPRSHGPDQEES